MRETEDNQTIDAYISSCPEAVRPKLRELRAIISEVEPEMKEKISWQMPTFYRKGSIIHFAAHKKHVGLYPGAAAIEQFSDRLEDYHTSKGAIQIPYEKAFDKALIRDIILFNLGNSDR
jgi:uncharacterized protein YdhG (YjbR/CyaY superfamily)